MWRARLANRHGPQLSCSPDSQHWAAAPYSSFSVDWLRAHGARDTEQRVKMATSTGNLLPPFETVILAFAFSVAIVFVAVVVWSAGRDTVNRWRDNGGRWL